MERSGRVEQKGHGCLEEQLVGISLSAQPAVDLQNPEKPSGCLVQRLSLSQSHVCAQGKKHQTSICPFCLPNDLANLSCQVVSSIYSTIDHLQYKVKCPSCNPPFSSPALGFCHARTAAPQASAASSQQQGAQFGGQC